MSRAYYEEPYYVPEVRCLPPCGAIEGPHLLDDCYATDGDRA